MYAAIVFLPIVASAIAGLFGRMIGARASELVTTGALCGLIEVGAAPRHVSATVADAPAVEFTVRHLPA